MAEIAGLKLIVPSSVSATGAGSSASVSASGKITFTSVETLTIEDCFSSTYDNYLIVARHNGSVETAIFGQYRTGGSTATGANYAWQRISANDTSVTGARATSATSAVMMIVSSAQRSGDHLYIYGPYLAQPTAARSVNVYGTDNARMSDRASTHSLSTSYESIVFTCNSGNITGALTIYGLSQ